MNASRWRIALQEVKKDGFVTKSYTYDEDGNTI